MDKEISQAHMNLCSWHHKKYQNYKAQRLHIKDNVATVTSHTGFQFFFFKAGAFSIFSRRDKGRIILRTENPKDMAHSASQLNQKVGLSYSLQHYFLTSCSPCLLCVARCGWTLNNIMNSVRPCMPSPSGSYVVTLSSLWLQSRTRTTSSTI